LENFEICYINPEDAINSKKYLDKMNLYKIQIKEGMNIVYNTNIIYYDNKNNTLPTGMNVESTVLFDLSRYKLDLRKQKIFRMSELKNKFNFQEKIICAYEYDVTEKDG